MLHQLVRIFISVYSLPCHTIPVPTINVTNSSTDPVDYTAVSVELTFSPGSPRNCQNIPIEDDDILEGTENLLASLTTSDPDVILAPDETEILILEDPNDSMCRVIRKRVPESYNLCTFVSQV